MVGCELISELNCWWLSGGAGNGPAYLEIYKHLRECPTCQARAATYGPPSAELTYRLENGRFYDTLENDMARMAAWRAEREMV